MNYINFKGVITMKFGIILENWPVAKFQSPTNMSHTEVEICFHSWESGTTRFRMLTNEEWVAWLNGQYVAPTAVQPMPAADSKSFPPTPTVTSLTTPIAPPTTATVPAPTESSVELPTRTSAAITSGPAATLTMPAEPPTSVQPMTAPTSVQPMTAPTEKRSVDETNTLAPPAKRARMEPMMINFVNSVTPAVSTAFIVPKAIHKKRSDTGVPCGPRKERPPPASENAAPAEISNAAAPKPHMCKKAVPPQEATATAGSSSSSL